MTHSAAGTSSTQYRYRYYRGVRYVAPWNPAPVGFSRCGICGRAWDDSKPTALTPAPSARCPFEHTHRNERTEMKSKLSLRYDSIKDEVNSNVDLINRLMEYGVEGAVTQLFIVEAIRRYAEACTTEEGKASLREKMKGEEAFITPESWIRAAEEVKYAFDRFYGEAK